MMTMIGMTGLVAQLVTIVLMPTDSDSYNDSTSGNISRGGRPRSVGRGRSRGPFASLIFLRHPTSIHPKIAGLSDIRQKQKQQRDVNNATMTSSSNDNVVDDHGS
jgi:hypothetical protein